MTDSAFTKGRVGLRALADEGCVNLPVTLRVSREFGELTEHGRGLALVRYCADVWCEPGTA